MPDFMARIHRRKHRVLFNQFLVLLCTFGVTFFIEVSFAAPNAGDEVLKHLEHTVDWYRRVSALNRAAETSQEATLQNTLHHESRQALQLGFDFARAEAAIIAANDMAGSTTTRPTSQASVSTDRGRRLAQLAATATQRIAQLQAEIDRLGTEIQTAASDSLPILTARRTVAAAELNLAKARSDVLKNIAGFTAGQEGGNGGLASKILDLEHSIPEAAVEAGQTSSTPVSASAKPEAVTEPRSFHTDSVGIFGLISEMFSVSHEMSELKDLADSTERLRQTNEKLRAPIRVELLDAIHRGDAMGEAKKSDDPKRLAAQSEELDTLTTRFKQLAGVGVPLGEQNTLLDSSRATLLEWHTMLGHEYSRAIRSLLFRLSAMGISIAVVLLLSALWQRATFHYVTDLRRRRQFMLIRRIVVGCLMAIIIAAGFVTEIASLATFAGIMTAGIAVALQTLILSGVAYFFFIGRYGVRTGDRVTVGGITGDVVETGLFRLYLMELGGVNHLQPTGRVVVFSNSVLFQPAGFFKQMPGADYIWQEISMKLAADIDYAVAETKLLETVNSVFADYREEIDGQHASAGEVIRMRLPAPRPQLRLHATESGVEFVARYPVPIQRAAEIDDRITKAILATIEQHPGLKLG